MDRIDLSHPAFAACAITASLMMMQVKGGYRAPEHARPTPLNPQPHLCQTDPNPRLAATLSCGYALSRVLHLWAYATAKSHDLRATIWTVGVLIFMGISAHALTKAIGVW